MNKNLLINQKYNGVNNYQSFDSTMRKDNIPETENMPIYGQHLNYSLINPMNYNQALDHS